MGKIIIEKPVIRFTKETIVDALIQSFGWGHVFTNNDSSTIFIEDNSDSTYNCSMYIMLNNPLFMEIQTVALARHTEVYYWMIVESGKIDSDPNFYPSDEVSAKMKKFYEILNSHFEVREKKYEI